VKCVIWILLALEIKNDIPDCLQQLECLCFIQHVIVQYVSRASILARITLAQCSHTREYSFLIFSSRYVSLLTYSSTFFSQTLSSVFVTLSAGSLGIMRAGTSARFSIARYHCHIGTSVQHIRRSPLLFS
jgi:hypothetical protein